MEKYIMAAALYLLGIFLFFIYHMFIRTTPKSYIEDVRKEIEFPFSDKALLTVIIVVNLLSSFAWPICTIADLKTALKGEPKND